MPSTVANVATAAHRVIPEMRLHLASADLRKAETHHSARDMRREIGHAIDRARLAVGWNLDELAAALPPPDGKATRDARQVRRWLEGHPAERAQFDVLFACEDEDFKAALIWQLSALAHRIARRTVLALEIAS